MNTVAAPGLPRSFWIISVLALLWNLLGLAMFAMHVTMSPEMLAAMPAAQREMVEATPGWVDAVFGLAVVTGVLGAVGLLLRGAWAVPMFAASLVALLVQVVGGYLVTPAWETTGAAGLVMPVLLLVIALALLGYARRARDRHWIS